MVNSGKQENTTYRTPSPLGLQLVAFTAGSAVMAPGLGPRLRHLLDQFSAELAPVAQQHDNVAMALSALKEQVDLTFVRVKRKRAGRPHMAQVDKVRRVQNQLQWTRRKLRRVQEKLRALTCGKNAASQNRMTPEFLTKVALSSPTTCGRAFASAWRDLVGVRKQGCCRTTIAKIRDAFVETIKEMRAMESQRSVAKCLAASQERRRSALGSSALLPGSAALALESAHPSCVAAILHIHDEASLRLRSDTDISGGGPSRSRSSKVQQHCVWLHVVGQPVIRWLAELDPLGDKTARTLACSVRKVLLLIAQAISAGFSVHDRPPWVVHILVGDAITTNAAVARILLSWVRQHPLPAQPRYFLIVVQCASHQANLVVASTVIGRAAFVAARESAAYSACDWDKRLQRDGTFPGKSVCGAIVRFFKYLVSDYYSDFLTNLRDIANSVQSGPPCADGEGQRWERLSRLYGPSVIPEQLLFLLDRGLDSWTHSVPAGLLPDQEIERLEEVRDGLYELLRKRLLCVDEHPTLSRMFTFTTHLEAFLLMHLLGCVPGLVKLRGVKPRDRARKRVTKVLAFFASPSVGQYLRRTALSLQLVAHVSALCAQLKEGPEPLLVRLAKGAVIERLGEDFGKILSMLHFDPDLDVVGAFTLLLGTAVEVATRYEQYKIWPFAAWELCAKFNQHGYLTACHDFVLAEPERLDEGFGLPLQRLARSVGDNVARQVQWLLSDPVQDAIVFAFESSAVSSLPVERAFAETKRSEAPRLCHVATAGRNQILRQFLRHREELLAVAAESARALRQAMAMRVESLAWELRPDLAEGARNGESVMRTREYVQANEPALRDEIWRRRRQAAAVVEQAANPEMPISTADWNAWFRTHEDEFYARMRDAPATRRRLNRRMFASPDTPQPVPRLGPRQPTVAARRLSDLCRILWGRSGWYLVECELNHRLLFFLYVFSKRTYVVDFSSMRAKGPHFVIRDNDARNIHTLLSPLDQVDFRNGRRVFEVVVSASATPGSVHLEVVRARLVDRPLRSNCTRQRKERSREKGEESEEEHDDGDDSDQQAFAAVAKDVHSSSSGSSCPSVDTDIDSGVEEPIKTSERKEDDALASDLEEEDDGVDTEEIGEASNTGVCRRSAVVEKMPAGTWTVWQSLWFYMTKTPGYTDMKMWVKGSLRNNTSGLGTKNLSKTITPKHYGDEWDTPWRSKLLLRSWALWRCKEWANLQTSRQREFQQEFERLERDLASARRSEPGRFLLGSQGAERLLSSWVPDLVVRLKAGS